EPFSTIVIARATKRVSPASTFSIMSITDLSGVRFQGHRISFSRDFFDLTVPWNSGHSSRFRILKNSMVAAFPNEAAIICFEMFEKIFKFMRHEGSILLSLNPHLRKDALPLPPDNIRATVQRLLLDFRVFLPAFRPGYSQPEIPRHNRYNRLPQPLHRSRSV